MLLTANTMTVTFLLVLLPFLDPQLDCLGSPLPRRGPSAGRISDFSPAFTCCSFLELKVWVADLGFGGVKGFRGLRFLGLGQV